SVCDAYAGGDAIDVSTNGGVNTVTLRNVTALATATGDAIRAVTQNAGGAVTVNVYNSIADAGGGGEDLGATALIAGTATINTNHSAYVPKLASGAGAAINTSVTDRHAEPMLDPITYRETAASTSTIGKGAIDPQAGGLDFEGDLRAPGGVTDIGADQYVIAKPAITGVSAAAAATGA